MWTPEHRRRHNIDRTLTKRGYPTDVTDQEWLLIEPLLHVATHTGRPHKTDFCAVIDALRYVVRSGCE